MEAKIADILVDFRNMRCSLCKILVRDKLATECRCGAKFTGVASNHVGLAAKLRQERGDTPAVVEANIDAKYPELVGG